MFSMMFKRVMAATKAIWGFLNTNLISGLILIVVAAIVAILVAIYLFRTLGITV